MVKILNLVNPMEKIFSFFCGKKEDSYMAVMHIVQHSNKQTQCMENNAITYIKRTTKFTCGSIFFLLLLLFIMLVHCIRKRRKFKYELAHWEIWKNVRSIKTHSKYINTRALAPIYVYPYIYCQNS